MTQQLTKFFIMFLMARLTMVPAYAQRAGTKVNIPFDYVLVGKTFSAGRYVVRLSTQEKVHIQDSHGLTVATVATNWLGGKVPEINGKLVFHCYAEKCFLSQIWVPGQEYGRSVPESRLEVKVKQKQTRGEVAVLTVQPTP